MKRWQKIVLAVAVPLVVLLAVYSVMYADTNQLADDVEVLLEGNPDGRVQVYPEVDHRYARTWWSGDKVEAWVERFFVIHNFSDGHMFVQYRIDAELEGDRKYLASPDYAIWAIHKEDGAWRIVDVYSPAGQPSNPLLFLYEYFTGRSHMDWNF